MEASMENTVQKSLFEPDRRLILGSVLFGILFSLLATKQYSGVNLFIGVLAVYAVGSFTLRDIIDKGFKNNVFAYLLTLPVLLLSLTPFLFSNDLVLLNFWVISLLIWVQYMLLTGKNAHDWYDIRFVLDFLMSIVMRLFGCFYKFCQHTFSFMFPKSKEKAHTGAKVFLGILAGLGTLIIILPLLLSADPNMQKELNLFFENIYIEDIFLYLFLFLLSASLCYGFIWSLKNDKPGIYSYKLPPIQKKALPAVSVIPALLVIIAVYLMFAAVQFKYFFSNYNTLMQTPNLTNSQYAVHGYMELILITLLNFIFLAISMKFTNTGDKNTPVFLKILYLFLIAFNFLILVSSHLRLSLYEYSFGFATGRFFPHICLILFAALNMVMLIKVFKPEMRAWKYILIVCIVFYTIINYIGIDSIVARANISRYYEKQQNPESIDEEYLLRLSDDAIPIVADFMGKENQALFAVRRVKDEEEAYEMGNGIYLTTDRKEIFIGHRLLGEKIYDLYIANSKWPSFSFSRQYAQIAWEKIHAILLKKGL